MERLQCDALQGLLEDLHGWRQDMWQDMARSESRVDERINGLESRFDGWRSSLVNSANAWRILKGYWKDCARPSGTSSDHATVWIP